MLGIGDKLPAFEVTGVKPGFNLHQESQTTVRFAAIIQSVAVALEAASAAMPAAAE
jgi:hypothetical protein